MNTIQQMIFDVDKVGKKINVSRDFEATVVHVWDAWTKPELLDQWWAPKPWRAETRTMDFREGGIWHYAMVGPDGEKAWCLVEYLKIDIRKKFDAVDAFCDEHAVRSADFPTSTWHVSFIARGNSTRVEVVIEYEEVEHLEKYIEMGFREGFTMALGNLDALLAAG